MNRFLSRILAGIAVFFARLISAIAIFTRGGKISHKRERAADDVDYLDSGSRQYETWLGVVSRLALLFRENEMRLGVSLPGLLADCYFRNLRVVAFPRGQQLGIEFVARATGIQAFSGHEHIIPLDPASEWDAASSRGRILREDCCTSSITHVTLAINDETRDFRLDEKSGFFLPTATKAA